jgi:hypothetical protein
VLTVEAVPVESDLQTDRRARSRASNGASTFLGNIDYRSREARRFIDVLNGLLHHVGGAESCGEVRIHLARRAAALVTWCEVQESKLVFENGKDFDPVVFATGCNSLRRLLLDLGVSPHLRDVTPDLAKYLATALDDDITDLDQADPEPEPEIVRRDSRGRPLKGTPEQAARAAHMRRVAQERREAREAARQEALKTAREAVRNGATKVVLPDPEPSRRPHRAAKLPPQPVKRGF